ncbi:hypothetical protein SKAU_G00345820 [Synaphobranchus kaupii]|uniref:Uncharacterized protein n=1 Tax=Synaphobranchus kaupii TaxID=118154 RepID=A0A9Q1EJE3_SYNKA|nr:hypothetical protein SKAU_G00345820 [Synaphobranchus kaupii]
MSQFTRAGAPPNPRPAPAVRAPGLLKALAAVRGDECRWGFRLNNYSRHRSSQLSLQSGSNLRIFRDLFGNAWRGWDCAGKAHFSISTFHGKNGDAATMTPECRAVVGNPTGHKPTWWKCFHAGGSRRLKAATAPCSCD